MRLVDARKGERLDDILVRPLHGERVLLVKGALVLVDHDAVTPQGVVAAAVKLAREQPFARPEGVGGIDDDQIVRILFAAHELDPVLDIDVQARVVQFAGGEGQVAPGNVDDRLVDLRQVDALDLGVACKLAHHAAVARADHQHVFHVRVHRHGGVHHHLVVDEFVLFGQHQVPVQHQHAPEGGGIEHVDALQVALAAVQLLVDADAQLHVFGVFFRKPKIHALPPYLSTFSRSMAASSGPVSWQPLSLA